MKKTPKKIAIDIVKLKRAIDKENFMSNEEFIKNYSKEVKKQPVDIVLVDNIGEGCLKKSSNSWLLMCDSKQSEGRKNFTIAHEFGHYLIHSDLKDEFICDNLYKESSIEDEANQFAVQFLMPADSFRQEEKHLNSINDFIKLAQKYKVSITACILRCVYFSKKPIAVVCSVDGGVLWHKPSQQFLKEGYWFKKNEFLPKESLVYEKNKDLITKEYSITNKRGQKITLREEIIRMPNYDNQILSLFTII